MVVQPCLAPATRNGMYNVAAGGQKINCSAGVNPEIKLFDPAWIKWQIFFFLTVKAVRLKYGYSTGSGKG